MLGSGKIPVYILTASDRSPLGKRVHGYFSSNLFEPYRVSIENPTDEGLKYSSNSLEYYRIKKVLENAAQNHPNSNLIIIKDTSVTNCSPEEIGSYVSEFNKIPDWDVFYLAYWKDECEKRKNIRKIGDKVIGIPYAPHGFQALIFTPKFRDIVLQRTCLPNGNYFAMNGNFSETLRSLKLSNQIVPHYADSNIFSFDKNLATDPKDIEKLNECLDPQDYQQNTTTTGAGNSGTSWIWILVIFAIFIILFFILFRNRKY